LGGLTGSLDHNGFRTSFVLLQKLLEAYKKDLNSNFEDCLRICFEKIIDKTQRGYVNLCLWGIRHDAGYTNIHRYFEHTGCESFAHAFNKHNLGRAASTPGGTLRFLEAVTAVFPPPRWKWHKLFTELLFKHPEIAAKDFGAVFGSMVAFHKPREEDVRTSFELFAKKYKAAAEPNQLMVELTDLIGRNLSEKNSKQRKCTNVTSIIREWAEPKKLVTGTVTYT
jgi:hypothetical protein